MQKIIFQKKLKILSLQELVCENFEIRNVLAQKIISNGWNLYSLTLQTNTLEDVFKTLTTGGEQ